MATPWEDIERAIEAPGQTPERLLALGEQILENWLEAKGFTPTEAKRESFRLLALHHQGAKDEPSFNACRETCRELAWHYNLLKDGGPEAGNAATRAMMVMVAKHLMLFVRGKMEVAELGEFCCSSRPIRALDKDELQTQARG
jgi:hypothetical protein